jgi:hypothetical protein
MKRFFKIFIVMLILTYVCMSVYGGSWDPVKWQSDVKNFLVIFILLDGVMAFFINLMID